MTLPASSVADRPAAPDGPPPASGWRYRPALDGIRALAILAVFGAHFAGFRFPGGGVAVQLLFVVSAWLITKMLHREYVSTGRVDLAAFHARRTLRLYPALLVVVVLTVIAAYATGHTHGVALAAGGSLLYVNNLLMAGNLMSDWLGHTWSLGAQEQFYLLWPVVMLFFLRRVPARRLGLWCVGLAVVLAAVEVPWRIAFGSPPTYFLPISAAVPFLAGIAAALLDLRARAWHAAVAGLGLVAYLHFGRVPWDAEYFYGPQQVATIACAVIVAYVTTSVGNHRLLAARPLVWLGRRSYGFYLIHQPLLWLLTYEAHLRVAETFAIGLALSLILAALSFRYVEEPFRRMRHRFDRIPSARGHPADTPSSRSTRRRIASEAA